MVGCSSIVQKIAHVGRFQLCYLIVTSCFKIKYQHLNLKKTLLFNNEKRKELKILILLIIVFKGQIYFLCLDLDLIYSSTNPKGHERQKQFFWMRTIIVLKRNPLILGCSKTVLFSFLTFIPNSLKNMCVYPCLQI